MAAPYRTGAVPVPSWSVTDEAPFDLSETDRLLSTTRAVRKRLDLDRPVDPEVILECLRLAVQAPTGSNSQTWRWMVITDPDKRARIAEAYSAIGGPYLRARPTRPRRARPSGSTRAPWP